jgi:hypothetical protein
MTDTQFQKVFDALRGRADAGPGNERINAEFDDMAVNDAQRVEPIVDGFIQEERAQRFKMLLEICGGRCSSVLQS